MSGAFGHILRATGILAALAASLVPLNGPPVGAVEPAYLSLMFSRATSQEADGSCTPYPGTVKIADLAVGLKQRGINTVIGSMVVDWADAAEAGKCVPWFDADGVRRGQTTAAGWTESKRLRDDGWKFVSHSKSYTDLTKITNAVARKRETCDTLTTFKAHGHTDAFGLFNFPNNKIDTLAASLVDTCFAYGRVYGSGINTRGSTSSIPHQVSAVSVSGGRCNNAKLACYSMPVVKNRRYTLPARIVSRLRPQAGEYSIVQYYRFVGGRRVGAAGPTWDCTSQNALDHWTTAPETYCLNDLWAALAARSSSAVITHPAAVAEAWGRKLL